MPKHKAMPLTDIFQYPVKGLSEAALESVALIPNAGMPGDRRFAITHKNSLFDYNKPAWIGRKNFTVVAHSPEIGPIHCQFDETTQLLTLEHHEKRLLQLRTDASDMNEQLSIALAGVIQDGQPGPYRLVSVDNTRLTDSATRTVSIMNTQSLHALEQAVDHSLQQRRFRGNLWFSGDSAWQEHGWIGKTIYIGEVKLFVTEAIERCAAIDADPILGTRNLNVLKQLNQSFRHVNFGVLAEVDVAGTVSLGDNIRVEHV